MRRRAARAPLVLALLLAATSLRPASGWNQCWEDPAAANALSNSGSSGALAVASLSGTAGVEEGAFVFDGSPSPNASSVRSLPAAPAGCVCVAPGR